MRRLAVSFTLAICVAAASLTALPAAGSVTEPPKWRLTVTPNAEWVIPGLHPGSYKIEAENVGGEPTTNSQQIILEDIVPSGFTAERVHFYASALHPTGEYSDLHEYVCTTTRRCKYPEGAISGLLPAVAPGQRLIMTVAISPPANFSGTIKDVAKISGGGAASAEASATNQASPEPPFGTLHVGSSLTDSSKTNPYTQAGGHPYEFSTDLKFQSYSDVELAREGEIKWDQQATDPYHDPHEVNSELPPGLIANPQGVPHCALAAYFNQECERKHAVGSADIWVFGRTDEYVLSPVFNLQPQGAYPGQLGVTVVGAPLIDITTGVRESSDYGVDASAAGGEASLNRVRINLWGVPADPLHDKLRGKECHGGTISFPAFATVESECEEEAGFVLGGGPAEVEPTPFVTLPTECSGRPLLSRGSYDSWDQPGVFATGSATLAAVDGCNALSFEPTIEARSTTNLADAPSGLEFAIHIPQQALRSNPNEPIQSELKEAVVKLPSGLVVNPASGNGLTGCSPAQIGMSTAVGETPAHFAEEPPHCPESSAIGTAEVNTPLLHNPLKGVVYLASQGQNPFGSLLAAYIVLEGEGLIFKLPGEIEVDHETGQVTSKFLENPQLPFEDLHLRFFGGARGDFRTPVTCGEHETTSVLTPFSAPESGPPAEPTDNFEINNGGAPCARLASQEPNGPLFRAGTESPEAGKFSPFALKLVREDGSQEFSKVETILPPGLVGRLAGVAECPQGAIEAAERKSGTEEKEIPSCPASSQVGTVETALGAGPTPLYVPGHAYLAGPYKGAPLSLVIVSPALGGPLDLGDVVVRSALQVNPETAQIRTVSDPIPHILQGIPLDIRSVTLKMDRPNFTLNPTDCEELHFSGFETSVLDSAAPLSQRFQVGGCSTLRFKPKLSLSLKGRLTRGGTPALTAHLTMKGGEANIAKAQVTLPPTELVDNAHLRNVCTRAQFGEGHCPSDSVIGHAKAVTPLLDNPLEGPVYLMTGFGHQLPDLAIDLGGQIPVFLHGKVDRGKGGGLRNTFEVVPDAPVSAFTLALAGAKKGLIENEGNLCAKPERATAEFTGQNGAVSLSEPLLRLKCKKVSKHHHKHKRHRAG